MTRKCSNFCWRKPFTQHLRNSKRLDAWLLPRMFVRKSCGDIAPILRPYVADRYSEMFWHWWSIQSRRLDIFTAERPWIPYCISSIIYEMSSVVMLWYILRANIVDEQMSLTNMPAMFMLNHEPKSAVGQLRELSKVVDGGKASCISWCRNPDKA